MPRAGVDMSRHGNTVRLIETAAEILAEHNPMTVRQVYYQLVSRQSRQKQPVDRTATTTVSDLELLLPS